MLGSALQPVRHLCGRGEARLQQADPGAFLPGHLEVGGHHALSLVAYTASQFRCRGFPCCARLTQSKAASCMPVPNSKESVAGSGSLDACDCSCLLQCYHSARRSNNGFTCACVDADRTRSSDHAASHRSVHVDPDTHRAHDAALPLGLHVWPADLLHDDLPRRHSAPLQQIFSLGKGNTEVGFALLTWQCIY